ncbi:MAG: class I SAM-dependent methyltransferase [Aureispira sp.]|nr:class I SAM-dependent methyltransferase [Aureispira sp.]
MRWRWKIAQAVEIRWWQRYLKNKEKSDYLAWKTNYWRTFLDKCAVQVLEGAYCLDAGCGPAGIFTILDQQKVDAIDPLLDTYGSKIDHFNPEEYPYAKFKNQALEDLEGKDVYDYIFCLNAINHVSDIELCMDRLWAALKPKGTLVLSIDSHNYKVFKHIFRLLPGDILHPHQYDLKEYENMVTNRGGNIVQTIQIDKAFWFNYYTIVATKQ